MRRNTLKTALLGALAGLGLGTATTEAREPFMIAPIPPNALVGVPVGANLPLDGVWVSQRNLVSWGPVLDDNGNEVGLDLEAAAAGVQLHFVPGWEILGGSYRASALVAGLRIRQEAVDPIPDFLQDDALNFALSDTLISPLNIHWELQPGIFAMAGTGVILPTGENTGRNAANDFSEVGWSAGGYTFFGQTGLSYLRDGWNLSGSFMYFHSTENPRTNYNSGDEILLTGTAMKDLGFVDDALAGFSFGPVGYYRQQITEDDNNGTFFGGQTFGKARSLGYGLAMSKRVGPVNVEFNYTREAGSRGTYSPQAFQLSFTVPLAIFD